MAALLYLFTGPEAGDRNEAVANIKAAAEKKYGQLDSYVLYASEISVQEVVSLLRNGSLFAAAKFVVLRNAELIKKKDEIETIASWAQEASGAYADGSVLVLVSEETSVEKKLENIIPKENKKIFWEMFENRKESWLRDFFKKNGYSLTVNAAELILAFVENNTEELRAECSRFFVLFEKGHEITADDVENVLANNREETPFSLFSAMTADVSSAERLENSLLILQKICCSKQSNAVQFIAGLVWCFRHLQFWHRLSEKGLPSEFDLKINGFSSKKMQLQYKKAARIWNPAQTACILMLLAETDILLRSGAQNMETVLLQMLIYSIVVKNGDAPARYEQLL
ncbi:MAG: DNA polymerase III subunit delta [Bacteroides sp.]|nr:DNA polymerase III subunit delta [Prevotella sp.]MCM1408789.1 DNA polymerase III subunit delta [Treponema brennaborense]MCM1470569.1 DNA polymerase III subunit delta [Bacteroides sp.]